MQGAILAALRKLVHDSVPGVTEAFKWGRPVYRANKDFAYLKTEKAYVTMGFFNTAKIKDPKGLLEGTGVEMRHIKLRSLADVDGAMLKMWLRAAASVAVIAGGDGSTPAR